jgi:hypothetical protein
MNPRLAHLLKRHRYSLKQKGLDSLPTLLQAVRLDLVKVYVVLAEIYQRTAAEVIREFFADQPDLIAEILPKVDQPRLHHLGFEVHEPHDLILPGFYRWTPQLSRWLNKPIQINGTLRFPSSANFQKRVGAYTEMMQIWVEVGNRELLIEMFDIYRPRPNTWLSLKQAANFSTWSAWVRAFADGQNRVKLPSLLAGDEIWHYGIHVADPAAVEALHIRFQALIHDNAPYKLAYDQPVGNPRDMSFHTKIINKQLGLEIEFLTQNLIERLEIGD